MYPVTDASQGYRNHCHSGLSLPVLPCSDNCSWRLVTHDSPMLLGSPGVVVQIDESLLSHIPKVQTQKKSENKHNNNVISNG